MKLYYTRGACSLVARIVINELELDCAFESVDLRAKKTEAGTDFFSINPKGAVPTLQLDNGDVLTEDAIILQYLAESSKNVSLVPSTNDFNRYRVLEWLNYVATELHKGIGILFNPAITEELRQQIFLPLIKAKLTYINTQLQHKQYLLGADFTLPDAYLFVMLRWASYFKLNLHEWGNLERYFEVLKKRPSIVRSLNQEELG